MIAVALVTAESEQTKLVGFGRTQGRVQQYIPARQTRQIKLRCRQIIVRAGIVSRTQRPGDGHVAISFVLKSDGNLWHPAILINNGVTGEFDLDSNDILPDRLAGQRGTQAE